MKNVLLFLCLITPFFVTGQSTYYNVIIENPTDQFITCVYQKSGDSEPKFFKLKLRPTNEVVFSFEIDQDQFVKFIYDKKEIELYVEKGDDLKMKFDATRLNESLQFEGKGSENNNYIASYNRSRSNKKNDVYKSRYFNVAYDAAIPGRVETTDLMPYINGVEKWRQTRKEELMSASISKMLKDYYQTKIKYVADAENLAYHLYSKNIAGRSHNGKIEVPLSNDLDTKHPDVINFLKALTLYNNIDTDFENPDKSFIYDNISKQFTGKPKYFMQALMMVNVFQKSNNANFAIDRFEQFKNSNPYPNFNQMVIDGLEGELQFMPEAEAPDFEVVMDNGRKVKLSDYKGRVVYISFWASWCKPCLQGFEKSQDIRKRLEQNGVVLLNVSIDKTENKWRNSMAKENILGTNCLAANIDDMKRLYDIGSIPAYYIVNKKGKFAYLSEKQGRDIFEEFNKLVRE